MKNALIALLITTGAMACADNRPAQNPTTTTTTNAASTTTVATTPHDSVAPTTTTATTAAETPTAVSGDTGTSSVTTAGSTSSMTSSDPSNGAPILGSTRSTAANDSSGTATSKTTSTLTPMDQGGSKGDRDITAAIRRDVVGDKSLSFSGKNVKIITKDGHVTLRGQVKTDAEKATIDTKARNAAGVLDVDNQLEVKK